MPFKLICKTDNYSEKFERYEDAILEYEKHYVKEHDVSLVSVGISSFSEINDILNKEPIEHDGIFRIKKAKKSHLENISKKIKRSEIDEVKGIQEIHFRKEEAFNSIEKLNVDNIEQIESNFKNDEKDFSKKVEIKVLDSDSSKNENKRFDFYFEKLVKLVPSEIVALYLTLYTIGIEEINSNSSYGKWITIICFCLVFISRILGTKKGGYTTLRFIKTAQWKAIFISAISFLVWIYAMGHTPFEEYIEFKKVYIKSAVVIWTFIIPYFYNGE